LASPWACCTDRTSRDRYHKCRSAGSACIPRKFPRRPTHSHYSKSLAGKNILVPLRFSGGDAPLPSALRWPLEEPLPCPGLL
jgi:hypothetical protein